MNKSSTDHAARPKSGQTPREPSTLWAAWRIGAEPTWQNAVEDAGTQAFNDAFRSAHGDEIEAIAAQLQAIDKERAQALDAAKGHLELDLLRFGILVGFSLARTWPDKIEDVDAWPARVIAYAGLKSDDNEENQ